MTALAQLIGIPYKDHGRDLTGVDCYGMVKLYYALAHKTVLPEYKFHYASSADQGECQSAIKVGQGDGNWVPDVVIEPGNILLFNIAGKMCHCGVAIGAEYFLHCLPGRNSCIESLAAISWANRLAGVYKWKA